MPVLFYICLTGQMARCVHTATEFCLLDWTDYTRNISVPSLHDFRVNDPVKFVQEGGSLCDELAEDTQYYVVATTATTISVIQQPKPVTHR